MASKKKAVLWHQVTGRHPDNHTYRLAADGTQRCHLCGEVEDVRLRPGVDERTQRAAAHLVHAVREHPDVTIEEWEAA